MAKKVYKAICPDGSIITRTTDRVYVAAVIAQESYDFALAQADQDWKNDGENWQYVADKVSGRRAYSTWESDAQKEADRERAAKYDSPQAAIAGYREARIAAVNEAKAAGYYEQWGLIGFCGRVDLAQKAASKAEGGRYSDVRIVPAVL